MGKYMRKCRGAAGAEVAAVEATQVVGVRTRSRAASAVGAVSGGVAKVVRKRRKALPPATEPAALGSGCDDGSCYLQLRSRMLFKAPSASPQKALVTAETTGAGEFAPLAAGLSRCSSTASSVDASAQERSAACRSSDAAEAGGDHVPEGSATNSGCARDRERREATPSSQAHGELSDLESDLAGQKSGRSLPAALPLQPVRPPAAEIEEFFAAAEAAEAERFASKYNFDVVRGVPLNAGRFEWTPVVSI